MDDSTKDTITKVVIPWIVGLTVIPFGIGLLLVVNAEDKRQRRRLGLDSRRK